MLFTNINNSILCEAYKLLDKIKVNLNKFHNFSDNELRNESDNLRKYINYETYYIRRKIKLLNNKLLINNFKLKKKINNLNKKLFFIEENILKKILPYAYSIFIETVNRFFNNNLTVNVSNFDINLYKKNRDYIFIKNNKVIWKNHWIINNKEKKWNMKFYDVQIICGIILHMGKIAEMNTGEGKTLSSTLPIYLNSLANRKVYIITANEYLSKRDYIWMRPIIEFHKISVDCINCYSSIEKNRYNAYKSNIVYGTANSFAFDYLRSNINLLNINKNNLKFDFAIIDEIDSILIDEARTPLIISDENKLNINNKIYLYYNIKKLIIKLIKQQIYIINKLLIDVIYNKKLDNNKIGIKLLKINRGYPNNKIFIKILSENKNFRELLYNTELIYLKEYEKYMHMIDKELYFTIDEKNNNVELTDRGMIYLSFLMKNRNIFTLPDINKYIKFNINNNKDNNYYKYNILDMYLFHIDKLNIINKLLKAYLLFHKNIDYLVVNKKIEIIDKQTGRVVNNRKYSDNLQQAIEIKENINIRSFSKIIASISLQNYFRMYNKLSGMTGTASTDSLEFFQIYNLEVIKIPTNKFNRRIDYKDKIFLTKKLKYNKIVSEVTYLSKNKNRPILIGTSSIKDSEFLSKLLDDANIKHNVLNAKYHLKESEIISKAGNKGIVTIATNMAGRGTDIYISPEVNKLGGLAIISVGRNESRRIDNQLIGRSGRQGDNGSSQFYISLEDSLLRIFSYDNVVNFFKEKINNKDYKYLLKNDMIIKSINNVQIQIEKNNFYIRRKLLEYDNILDIHRKVIYCIKKDIYFNRFINIDIMHMINFILFNTFKKKYSICYIDSFIYILKYFFNIQYKFYYNNNKYEIYYNIYLEIIEKLLCKLYSIVNIVNIYLNNYINYINIKDNLNIVFNVCENKIIEIKFNCININNIYYNKNEYNCFFDILLKKILLSIVDNIWETHLCDNENLKYSIKNVVYEQINPITIYKKLMFNLFNYKLEYLIEKSIFYLFNLNVNNIY